MLDMKKKKKNNNKNQDIYDIDKGDALLPASSGKKLPNELGRVHMSINKQQVIPVEVEYVGDAMAREKSKKTNSNDIDASNAKNDQKAIDAIWKHLGLGHIDISYACIGYSLDGRPVLNYDDFVNLLVNYGFSIQDTTAFIEDFAAHSLSDNKSPIVMYSANTSAIMTSIEPIA